MQETLAALPYKDLSMFQLRPDGFKKYLTEQLGFNLLAERQVGSAAKGFDRPLLIFEKGDTGQQRKNM